MNDNGLLRITVQDSSGSPVPCRLHIKQQDGSAWMPPDGEDAGAAGYSDDQAPDLLLASHYDRYLHIVHDKGLQSVHLNHGTAKITVPQGEFQIFLARGHEFIPVRDTIHIKAGRTEVKQFRLARLVDMPADGWYGGDMHTHFSRWQKSDDHVWTRLLWAEDIHAVNNMVYKHNGKVEAPQYAMGEQDHHRHHAHHHVIAGGEEFRDDNLYGHMIAAGIREVIEPISVGQSLGRCENYPLFASVCDWAHDQGGIAGWAHGGTVIKLFESLPVEAALGKLDFVENIQFNMFYGFMFWYRLLNCGIRLACTGGSDFPFSADLLAPWYPNLGLDRTYCQVDGEFTYTGWIEAIRQGRTFASNGPLLMMQVNGRPPGSELSLAGSDDQVLVEARAVCNYGLDCIEIVCNGEVVRHVEAGGGQNTVECAERIRIDRSCWLAARVRGIVEPGTYGGVRPWKLHAHTSPVYVSFGNKPIRIAADLTAMADYVRILMEVYDRRGDFASRDQRVHMMSNLGKALNFYESALLQ